MPASHGETLRAGGKKRLAQCHFFMPSVYTAGIFLPCRAHAIAFKTAAYAETWALCGTAPPEKLVALIHVIPMVDRRAPAQALFRRQSSFTITPPSGDPNMSDVVHNPA
ncbi:hypothetical protein [Cupriavidus sp. CuC1]|uniref:hypothetical protein n=1 Tax=Cupriavidus sp. CuC1 TaxID=3373131 RepID=UPI0037D8EA96